VVEFYGPCTFPAGSLLQAETKVTPRLLRVHTGKRRLATTGATA
jgi:hypothetical protein